MTNAQIDRHNLFYRAGSGNWDAYIETGLGLDPIFRAAEGWARRVAGIERPWLCWNVDHDWCLVQQRLVRSIGWTPVIGFDPRVGEPAHVVPEAVVIDFNKSFRFPVMWPHFPLEFAFLFTTKMAFWHADLLIRHDKIRKLAELFLAMQDGEMAAVGKHFSFSKLLKPKMRRYWELIGCTTKSASEDQFRKGCGWWMNFYAHPSCPSEEERIIRKQYYWDSGVGIRYWSDKYKRPIHLIEESLVQEGHCSQIKHDNYERLPPDEYGRDLPKELRHNFELAEVCSRLGLQDLLDA